MLNHFLENPKDFDRPINLSFTKLIGSSESSSHFYQMQAWLIFNIEDSIKWNDTDILHAECVDMHEMVMCSNLKNDNDMTANNDEQWCDKLLANEGFLSCVLVLYSWYILQHACSMNNLWYYYPEKKNKMCVHCAIKDYSYYAYMWWIISALIFMYTCNYMYYFVARGVTGNAKAKG